MTELAFPLVATLVLVVVAIPLATVLAKLLFVALRSRLVLSLWPQAGGIRQHGSTGRYLLIVAPVMVPTLWLGSAAMHHAEEEQAALACIFDHVSDGMCAEPLFIAAIIVSMLLLALWWRRRVATSAIARALRVHDGVALHRLASACASHPHLQALESRIQLVAGQQFRTVGWFDPCVEVGAAAVRRLDELSLAGALLHECVHVRARDPLRFLLASACQSINPVAFLLRDEWRLWRAGREAVCDEAAVHDGADACALAEALAAVARPLAGGGTVAAVGHQAAHLARGSGMSLLRARVNLLMGYVDAPPRCRCASAAPKWALIGMVALTVLPHYWGEGAIVRLHQGAERAVVTSFAPVPW